ncbi:uncharacterized protein LOC115737229 isoform X2 [Rhodamnia argentea]|uniref:Uncharacterized protein LOC115737229 isoform X2 n=1 Tax=Rhodamnia argentea TaxID=178133 RepID=A0A8B8NTB8_9MYRT|nr:uncharacterized protein LOC115737229 isoform X2 [Rhodamnia argentea]
MVRSKALSKKQQKKGIDFKKIKRKVGRKLPPPKNATNTEIKSKAIVLPEQSVASDRSGLAVNKKGLTLKELLQQTSHHNPKVRRDALMGIKDLFLKHPDELRLHMYAVIEKLRERIGDDDKLVREALYELFKSVIFPSCKEGNQRPFVSLMMAYIFNAMTHLAVDVRLMAFRFLGLVVLHYPPTFLLYAEKILQSYEDILCKHQLFAQDRSKLKTALAGLMCCLSLLPCNDQEDDASEKKTAGKRLLHGFEQDAYASSSGYTLVLQKLKDLVPVLINCLREILSVVHTMPSLEFQSFDCMLCILQSIDRAVKFFISRIDKAKSDLQPTLGGATLTTLDQGVVSVILKRLCVLFPLNAAHRVSQKDGDRYFTLNVVIAGIFLSCSEWISPPDDLAERFLEFLEVMLLGKITDSAKTEATVRDKHLLLPFIPKLLAQVPNSWKSRLLQAFTKAFRDCNHQSSLKLAFLSIVEEIMIPGQNMISLDVSDPELLDHQIAWVRELPTLLILLGEKHQSDTQVVLHLILRLGQSASSRPALQWEYDNIQHTLLDFFSKCQDESRVSYGPFIRLSQDCQELAVCCLYYFSRLDSALLEAITTYCLCDDLEPSVLFRTIEVLDSAYTAGHIWISDIISFFITLLLRFKISPDNALPVKEHELKISNCGTFRLLTSVVCSCLLHIGDESMVLQMIEKVIIDQIKLKPPRDNACALLRLLVTLDSKPTRLSEQTIDRLASFLALYLIDVFSVVIPHISGDDDEATVAVLARMTHYYVLPCLFLFDRSHKLLKLVLNKMESLISDRNSLSCSENGSHGTDHSTSVIAIVYGLQLMHKDFKIQQILSSFKAEIECILRSLQALVENSTTLEERHKLQCAYVRVHRMLGNLQELQERTLCLL